MWSLAVSSKLVSAQLQRHVQPRVQNPQQSIWLHMRPWLLAIVICCIHAFTKVWAAQTHNQNYWTSHLLQTNCIQAVILHCHPMQSEEGTVSWRCHCRRNVACSRCSSFCPDHSFSAPPLPTPLLVSVNISILNISRGEQMDHMSTQDFSTRPARYLCVAIIVSRRQCFSRGLVTLGV